MTTKLDRAANAVHAWYSTGIRLCASEANKAELLAERDELVFCIGAIQKLVDEQAEDVLLWPLPHYVPSAHVVARALRRLHAAVEAE